MNFDRLLLAQPALWRCRRDRPCTESTGLQDTHTYTGLELLLPGALAGVVACLCELALFALRICSSTRRAGFPRVQYTTSTCYCCCMAVTPLLSRPASAQGYQPCPARFRPELRACVHVCEPFSFLIAAMVATQGLKDHARRVGSRCRQEALSDQVRESASTACSSPMPAAPLHDPHPRASLGCSQASPLWACALTPQHMQRLTAVTRMGFGARTVN